MSNSSLPRAQVDVLVVCDLGPALGIGHAMRCVALAEELAGRGLTVRFVADVASVTFVQRNLESRGFTWVPPPEDVPGYLQLFDDVDPRYVVIDSYVLPAELYAASAAGRRTLALVDGDPGARIAHLYIDQNLGAEDDQWDLPPGSRRLAGLQFALLRDDVVSLRPRHPRQRAGPGPSRVLAVFGGTDAFGAGPVAAQLLAATGHPLVLTLVAGNADVERQTAGLQMAAHQHLEIVAPTDRLAALAVDSDLVVSAAGTSSWELLCLGAACAMVCVAENQHVSYDRMVAAGAVVGLGSLDRLRHDHADAARAVARVLEEPEELRRLSARAQRMVDGRGKERVVDALLAMGPLV
jgi:spore coat polysaccharide biosynthesis predicted glycosyltransferase SpsG